MKLWEKQIEFQPNKTKGLLYKIAGDLFISHLRKMKTSENYLQSIPFQVHHENPETEMKFNELKLNYEKVLAELPEKQRIVFLMNRIEEMTYVEIAERLELSVKAVEKRMSLALKELKTKLNYNG